MGVDIHMHIVKDNKVIKEDIYWGRDSEWFNLLNGRNRGETEYDYLDDMPGMSPQAPDNFQDIYENARKNFYYGFHYISVKAFKIWFEQYRPNIQAGYVSTYDKWRIEKKGYVPYDLPTDLSYIDDPALLNDMHFIEYENPYDSSKRVYDYLVANKISLDADIVYWFDC